MKAKQITTFICGFLIGIILLVALMLTVIYFGNIQFTSVTEITTAEFLYKVRNDDAKELIQYPNKFELIDKNSCCIYFAKTTSIDENFIELVLTEAGYKSIPVKFEVNETSYFWNFVINILPILFFAVFWASLFAICFSKLIKKFRTAYELK